MSQTPSFRVAAPIVVLLVVLAAVAMSFAAAPASAQEAATEIDECTTIDEPGRYVLTEDIEDSDDETCIEIRASDVTLDGNGYAIDGVDDSQQGAGVRVADEGDQDGLAPSNVTLRDLTATDWQVGISFLSAAGTVTGVQATSNRIGLAVGNSDVKATDSEFSDNTFGIQTSIDVLSPGGDIGLHNLTLNNNGIGVADFSENGATINVTDAVVTDSGTGFFTDTGSIAVSTAEVRNTDEAYIGYGPLSDFTIDSATIAVEEGFMGIAAVEEAPADPEGLANVGQYVNVASDRNFGLSLEMQYDDEAVEKAGIDERTLRLYKFEDGEWTEVDDSSVDTDANVVSGTVVVDTVLGINPEPEDYRTVAPLGQLSDDGADDGGDGDGDVGGADDGKDGDGDDGDRTDGSEGDAGDGDGKDADGDDADTDAGDETDGDDGAKDADGEEKDEDTDADEGGDADDSNDGSGDGNDIGVKDVSVDLGEVVIADFELRGPGIADEHIDERTYSIGGFDVEIDGLSLTIGGTDYRFGHLTIDVELFDVTFENVTLGDGE